MLLTLGDTRMTSLYPFTKKGHTRLSEELKRLKTIDRPAVIDAIAEARAHGDLKENAEYHAARERQSFLEGRIQMLDGKLSNSQVIDVTQHSNKGKVIFGATVTIVNEETNEETTYQIVGEEEADLENNKVSVKSPFARALVGKFKDDSVDFDAPDGMKSYEIIDVKYI